MPEEFDRPKSSQPDKNPPPPSNAVGGESGERPSRPDPPVNPEERDDDDFDREIETTARPVGSSSSRRPSAKSIAASQALASNPPQRTSRDRGPSSRSRVGDPPRRSYGAPQDYRSRTYDDRSPRQGAGRYSHGAATAGRYGRDIGVGGGAGGGGGGARGGSPPMGSKERPQKLGKLTVIVISILIAFFTGFAMRDLYTAKSGFDDERFVQAEQVPSNLRRFCVDYNGLPSFTLVNLDSISALSSSSVSVLKLDTCTIPTNQTANALQALGVDRRATSIGLQLGGSNLTLVNLPVTGSLSVQLLAQFPALADSLDGRDREAKEAALADILDTMLRSGANGLALQNIIKTNKTDVYAVAPGHTFQLQPNIQAPEPVQ